MEGRGSARRDGEVAWRPDDTVRRRSRTGRLLAYCGLGSFEELHAWSVRDPAAFTELILRFLEVRFDRPFDSVLDLSRGLPWARWCVGGGLNITRTCLDRHEGTAAWRHHAVIWEGEEGTERAWTYPELAAVVDRAAAGLRALGIRRGDALGLHLPMLPETAAALLAAARVGAVAVPLFSGYGPDAIASRLRDVEARVLITCDGFPRRGRPIGAKATADEALRACPSVERMVVVERLGLDVPFVPGRDLTWDELLERGDRAAPGSGDAEPTGAEDPLLVLYTSGTTGRPKGILHTHCSFPIKGAQDMALGCDVGPGDRILWVTDLGWMMGPWLLYGATALGATAVLYDGAVDWPRPGRLWEVAARHGVGILGVSPTLVRSLMTYGEAPPAAYDLSRLRILASTGEPWNPDPWWWLFETVGRGRVPIINYSGGTEISGGILMGNPLLPVKPCAFAAPCPGIAADVLDAEGRPVREGVGELVIRGPWIGMARGFWKDPERYLETYWSRWPDVWVHGDWARVDSDGHWHLLGRSDDTLKVAGKRVGPAEVESVLVGHPDIAEAAVIGEPDEVKGTRLVGVCVPVAAPLDPDGLATELRERVAAALGKPLRPGRIVFVRSLPKTRNGKVMRRVVRAAWLGEDPGDLSALEDPGAVEALREARRQGGGGARA
jgi:acetyl-CoA synthetase